MYQVTQAPVYLVGTDPSTGQLVPGYRVVAQDTQTGAVATVFVPEAVYSPENVDAAIVHDLTLHNQVLALGAESPTSQSG